MLRYFRSFGGLLAFIAFWQIWITFGDIPLWLMPGPLDVLTSLFEDFGLLLSHGGYTLVAALSGFALALVLGMILALAMNYWPILGKEIYPLLVLSQTIPIITVAPLIIIWFGYGLLPKILVVALVCIFPITVSLLSGMDSIDIELVDLMRVMGASRRQIIVMAKLPAAMPSFFSGLKISATYCVMAAVIGEWLGASYGLGVILTRASHSYQTGRAFAAITAVVLLSLLLVLIVELSARITIPWHYQRTK
ncbi:MAG: ABC transporter permease [Peptococcaceae bacterium]|nr:ABC transporter permease [Peptococcaceae bacterium]